MKFLMIISFFGFLNFLSPTNEIEKRANEEEVSCTCATDYNGRVDAARTYWCTGSQGGKYCMKLSSRTGRWYKYYKK